MPRSRSTRTILALYNRGLAYRDKGDYDRAIADFGKVVALDPKNALAFNHRGLAYRGKGDLDRALASFEQAVKLDPGMAMAFGNRGVTYGMKGDTDRAVADFDQAAKLDPQDARAFTIAASPGATRAVSTARWRISMPRSSSIRNTRSRSTPRQRVLLEKGLRSRHR